MKSRISYSNEIPNIILEFSKVKEMQRLKDISMSCGMNNTSSKIYLSHTQNKFDHSLNSALIVWNFTKDINQSLSALFHDISTPVFAHVVDFMNGDHENQESTEDKTLEIILNSSEISVLLNKYKIDPYDICNYHIYPIADNDSPKLSSDRLEYTLSNFIEFSLCSSDLVQSIYDNITVSKNELSEIELCFCSYYYASVFSKMSLECSKIYSSSFCRAAMEYISNMLKYAIKQGLVSYNDLFILSEKEIIYKFISDNRLSEMWNNLSHVSRCKVVEKPIVNSFNVKAKLRYIDPFIITLNSRISTFDKNIKSEIIKYKSKSFDENLVLI